MSAPRHWSYDRVEWLVASGQGERHAIHIGHFMAWLVVRRALAHAAALRASMGQLLHELSNPTA